MSVATNREQFKHKCLRRLGWPVLRINLDDDQIEDAIDYSLKYYADYHFDGTEKVYFKYQLAQNNFPSSVHNLVVANGGQNYSDSDTITLSAPDIQFGDQIQATGHLVVENGVITDAILDKNGLRYVNNPTVTINTSTGTGGQITSELGGWLRVPDNIIGAVRLFDLSSAMSSAALFSIQYQFVLNELYTFSSTYSMIPYYVTLQYIQLIEQLLTGLQRIRFNRHRHKLYVDMNWDKVTVGQFICAEAYQMVDPDEFTAVWDDRWLIQYCTAQIKRVWGSVMKKFGGIQTAGGIVLNGQIIFDEAEGEIMKLEQEMLTTYSIPVEMEMG